MVRDLSRLLSPKSIAVIGGGVWGASIINQCRLIGFQGAIWPVHPYRDAIGGINTVRSVAQLPSPPDAVFVGVNRNATVGVVAELAQMGAGGAICFASGFAEAEAELDGATALQAQLLEAAGAMPILGPNCYGFLNYLDGAALWPDQHGGIACDSGVAIVTQSSNIAINLTMQTRSLPLAYVVTVGNQAQTGLAEIGAALLADPRVTALGLHIEGIGDLRAFEALSHMAHDLGKPVIVLKVGASDQARSATISHTASLAGSDAGATALLARLGIGRVGSLPSFLETLKLLHVAGPLRSSKIASLSCSGGEASLMADAAIGLDLSFPPLDAHQKANLRAVLGPKVALANPLDYHTYIWGDTKALSACFTAMMTRDMGIGVVVLDFPRPDRCSYAAWEHVLVAVAAAQSASGVPMAVMASLPETMPEEISAQLIQIGVTPICGMVEGLQAIAVAAALGKARAPVDPLMLPEPHTASETLTEAQAKAELSAFGLRVPRSARTTDAPETAATQIGFPVVLKGEGIAHKTESGAVVLNLQTADAVAKAATAMACDSFLVEEMITGGIAELLIGVVCDPAHGYVMTLGAGGVLTELLADTVSFLVPTSRAAISGHLKRLKIAPVLAGWRGGPAASTDAIVDAVMAVQAYVIAHKPDEIEINPLICTAKEAIVADALIRRPTP